MKFKRLVLETCSEASGTVVVIDVVRAFTTAAYAFAAGAEDITLVGTIEQALSLRERIPGSLVMGEVDGLKPESFDLGNSPSALAGLDLTGCHLIQRTSAGTQGVVLSSATAETILTCSLCCARATARYVDKLSADTLTFVITGVFAGGQANNGDEDVACADYIEALLRGETPDIASFAQRVLDSHVAHRFFDPARPEFPSSDLKYCTDIDRFDFAMLVERQNDQLVLKPVR